LKVEYCTGKQVCRRHVAEEHGEGGALPWERSKRMDTAGTVTFWGVRGSIPAPSLHTVTFGGNTSCVSVEYGEHVVIFDAGSGLRKLGLYLQTRDAPPPITGCLSLDLETVMQPAIRHAKRGFRASLYLCELIWDNQAQ
jgi:hypothetical protein